MPHGPFLEFSAILVLASLVGILGRFLKQPLVVSFLVAGVLAGPFGIGLIKSYEEIELLARMGIALLLFIVGLKLDLGLIKSTGVTALLAGSAQMILTTVLGGGVALALGLDLREAAVVGVALAFSSTIIVVKLLSDKGEIDSLYGRVTVGILIVQDIAAVLALVALSTMAGKAAGGQESTFMISLQVAARGLGLLLGLGLLTRYGLPALLRRLANSQEMLLVFSISWAVFMGGLAEFLGFSTEVGAFLAGVALASTPYRDAISARLAALRDFLLLFFFINLGARLDLVSAEAWLAPALLLSGAVLVVKPLAVMIFTGLLGYGRRVGFLAGTSLAQTSEFSLILVAAAVSAGQVDRSILGLVTMVTVLTLLVSSYLILNSGPLYERVAPYIKIFQRRRLIGEPGQSGPGGDAPEFLILGLGDYGSGIAEALLERGRGVAGVDFDPAVIEGWRQRGLPVIYGDAGDPELHEHLPLEGTEWVVGSFRSLPLNLALLGFLRQAGFKGKVALAAGSDADSEALHGAGVQVVLRPFHDAAEQAADALAHAVGVMPDTDWPLAFRELRLKTGARYAGKTLRDIPLRQHTGVSVVAVGRAGQVHQAPGPEFLLMPGDRVVLVGPPPELALAEELLNQVRDSLVRDKADPFAVMEVQVPLGCRWSGASLSDLDFRRSFGATILGIIRANSLVSGHKAAEILQPGDRILLFGRPDDLQRIQALASSPEACPIQP